MTKTTLDAILNILSSSDITGGILMFVMIFIFVFFYAKKNVQNDYYNLFIVFFFYKILFTILFILTTKFGGESDTTLYYISTIEINAAETRYYFDFLLDTKEFGEYREFLKVFGDERSGYMSIMANSFVVRIGSLVSYFFFNSYSAICLFFSIFSFFGSWFFFKGFVKLYPELNKQMAIAILFLPSVCYWTSGYLKDPITFGSLGFMIYIMIQTLYFKTYKLKYFILFVVTAFLIFTIKPYILYVFLASAGVLFLFESDFFMKNRYLRNVIIMLSLLAFVYSSTTIFESIVEETKKGTEFYADVNSGSYVKFFEYDLSPLGIINMIFSSIIGVYYRPFVWEAKSILMFLSSLEALFLAFITLKALSGFRSWGKVINSNSILLFCLVFTVLFAIVVGFSTFNFGTVSRYKIPSLPLCFVMFYLLQKKQNV